MKEKNEKKVNDEVGLMITAFNSFNKTASDLEKYYLSLEEKIQKLNFELEKKNSELQESLRNKEEAESYLKNILESLTTGVIVINPEGRITNFNNEAEKITGFKAKDFNNKSFEEFFPRCFSQDSVFEKSLRDYDYVLEFETMISKKDGTRAMVKVSVSPMRSKSCETIGNIILLQDITDIHRRQEQEERNGRLMAMGELVGSMAHEIKNPLCSIELFTSMLKREFDDNDDRKRMADHILLSVRRVDCLLSNLLIFSRSQKTMLKEVELHSFLDDSLEFSDQLMLQNKIEVVRNFGAKDSVVRIDMELMKQVILNIILNAVQAMPEGGRFIIGTENKNGDADVKLSQKNDIIGLPKGLLKTVYQKDSEDEVCSNARELIVIGFSDKGTGIPKENIEKIFNPFFTTKETALGLGLPTINNIINSHGGTIEVESQEGKGSSFIITFPIGE